MKAKLLILVMLLLGMGLSACSGSAGNEVEEPGAPAESRPADGLMNSCDTLLKLIPGESHFKVVNIFDLGIQTSVTTPPKCQSPIFA